MIDDNSSQIPSLEAPDNQRSMLETFNPDWELQLAEAQAKIKHARSPIERQAAEAEARLAEKARFRTVQEYFDYWKEGLAARRLRVSIPKVEEVLSPVGDTPTVKEVNGWIGRQEKVIKKQLALLQLRNAGLVKIAPLDMPFGNISPAAGTRRTIGLMRYRTLQRDRPVDACFIMIERTPRDMFLCLSSPFNRPTHPYKMASTLTSTFYERVARFEGYEPTRLHVYCHMPLGNNFSNERLYLMMQPYSPDEERYFPMQAMRVKIPLVVHRLPHTAGLDAVLDLARPVLMENEPTRFRRMRCPELTA